MNELKDKKLYYVGGIVRDEFLGTKNIDVDYCYEGNAINFAQNNNLNIIKVNPSFGTVRVKMGENEVDIASTREEFYPAPGHLPVVKNIGCPLLNDLKRRDFTINAIAKNTYTGEIIDPFDGRADLDKKLIKVLHPLSFVDDPTRIVRALKFSVRFNFELDVESKKLQNDYLSHVNYDMSYHRLKKELVETFNLNDETAFDKFVEQNIYKLLGNNQIRPAIKGVNIKLALQNTKFIPWLIYLGFFNLENLPLTRQEKRILEWAEKLKTENITNNTPKESILLHKLFEEAKC